MIRQWVAYALIIGIVLSIAALTIEAFCHAIRRPARWVWLAALSATVVLVGIAPLRQTTGVRFEGKVRVITTAANPGAGVARTPIAIVRKAIAAATQPLSDALALAARIPVSFDRWIIVVWATAATVVLIVLLVAYARWRAATLRWPSSQLHGVRVRIAPEAGPAAVGVIAPEVVVPRWLLDTPQEQQRLALAHEMEHMRARDPLLLVVGCIPAVLLPWHPAVWWMLSRLRLAVEMDCDARVLGRATNDAREYGTALIDLAQRCGGARLGAPALAEGSTHLERRLIAMTATHSRSARVRAGTIALIAVAALVAACETHLPTQADVDSLNVRSAEKFARVDGATVFTVDGNVVSRDSAERLAAAGVVGMESKYTTDGRVSSMDLRTKQRGGELRLNDRGVRSRVPGDKFNGLVYIDGVKVNASALASLQPKDISRVEVLKGAAAAKAYSDPAAANGVIVVTTVTGAQAK